MNPNILEMTQGLKLNLLLSAKVATFLKVKPPQLVKMKEWGEWNDPVHHWVSNWRVEECFRVKGARERVVMVTNEKSRFSFLIAIKPGDVPGFLSRMQELLCLELDRYKVARPTHVEVAVMMLSGAARSLSGFQNQQMYAVDTWFERHDEIDLGDLQKYLNKMVTLKPKAIWPFEEFEKLCREEPPFEDDEPPKNVIFLN